MEDDDIDGVPWEPPSSLGSTATPVVTTSQSSVWLSEADQLAPSSIQSSDKLIRGFTVGVKRNSPFQKHKDQREAKKKKEEEEVNKYYEDFVQSFQPEPQTKTQSFVRGETIVNNRVVETSGGARDYMPHPPSRLPNRPSSHSLPDQRTVSQHSSDQRTVSQHSSDQRRKKRSIDELRDELQRHSRPAHSARQSQELSQDNLPAPPDDTTTTLRLTSAASQVSKAFLWRELGAFGSILHVERWESPGEQGIAAQVTFVERSAAVNAFRQLRHRTFFGHPLQLQWGSHSPSLPTPQTSQETPESHSASPLVIRVTVPEELTARRLRRWAAAVTKAGCLGSPVGLSLWHQLPLEGLTVSERTFLQWEVWRQYHGNPIPAEPFQMFSGGPLWLPPVANDTTRSDARDESVDFAAQLSQLTGERQSIRATLAWTMDRADRAPLWIALIAATLIQPQPSPATQPQPSPVTQPQPSPVTQPQPSPVTQPQAQTQPALPLHRLLALWWLVNDLLSNAALPVAGASTFRTAWEAVAPTVTMAAHRRLESIPGRITSANLRQQLLRLLRLWESWAVYPQSFTDHLAHLLLHGDEKEKRENSSENPTEAVAPPEEDEDIDGVPIEM